MRPTHVLGANLLDYESVELNVNLHSKSMDVNVNYRLKIPSQQHLDWC